MAYLDVVPLETVKTYLRIDDTQNETDAEITSMIKSACSYIERYTNILIFARDKNYTLDNGCLRIYDHPINSVIDVTDFDVEVKRLYSNYVFSSSLENITLNVGYVNAVDVPSELIDLILVVVKSMFYAEETNQNFRDMLPDWGNKILNQNRRFLI